MGKQMIIKKYLWGIIALVFTIVIMLHFMRNNNSGNLEQRTESELEFEEVQNTQISENIRVLLLSTGYTSTVHPSVQLSAPSGLKVCYGDTEEKWEAAEILNISPDDSRFSDNSIRIEAVNPGEEICVGNIDRSYGNPTYAGILELRTTAEGIAMINELPVEQYLCKVVPSEMPASYELEALKAQAVCARSYAYRQMTEYGYPEYEAHVDDSTKFQVYNNSLAQESSSQAVLETAGQEVWYKGSVATTYYYSTSCGKTTDIGAWGSTVNEANAYLQSVSVSGKDGDYEKELPWYKWTATASVQTLSNLVALNTGTELGMIQSIEVTKRGAGDIALQMVVTGDKGSVAVDTENKIRTALGGSGYTITKNDGTVVDSTKLLPSAFFAIEKQGDSFVIAGGGLGHGIGMSQNGANEMAKEGKNYKEILQMFYKDIKVE